MTRKEFENSKQPLCFFAGIDPTTGERNFEYLEGWDWSGYVESINKDFPERFSIFRRNRVAKKMYFEAHGVTGLFPEAEEPINAGN